MDADELKASLRENLVVSFARSGGPGGQNVNKVNTKARVGVPLEALRGISEAERSVLREKLAANINREGFLFVFCDEERGQSLNRAIAEKRLEAKIFAALVPKKKRVKTTPTKASRERRLKLKKLRSQVKQNRAKILLD